jgi:hypothetical protein
MNVDGSAHTGTTGTGTGTGLANLGSAGGSQFFGGFINELGYWPAAFTPTQSTNMSGNQHAFWGF